MIAWDERATMKREYTRIQCGKFRSTHTKGPTPRGVLVPPVNRSTLRSSIGDDAGKLAVHALQLGVSASTVPPSYQLKSCTGLDGFFFDASFSPELSQIVSPSTTGFPGAPCSNGPACSPDSGSNSLGAHFVLSPPPPPPPQHHLATWVKGTKFSNNTRRTPVAPLHLPPTAARVHLQPVSECRGAPSGVNSSAHRPGFTGSTPEMEESGPSIGGPRPVAIHPSVPAGSCLQPRTHTLDEPLSVTT